MMKTLISLILSFFTLSIIYAQQDVSFENETLGLAFHGSSNWINLSDSEDAIFELQNKNHNLNLKMWKVNDNNPPQFFLPHFVESEGMATLIGPFQTEIDDQRAYGIIAMCNEKRQPVKMLVIAFESEDGICVIRFKCPDECFRDHRKQMNELLGAIRIMDKAGTQIYLAGDLAVADMTFSYNKAFKELR